MIAIVGVRYRNYAYYEVYRSCLLYYRVSIIRSLSFSFFDDFEGNAKISVAIKSGSTVTETSNYSNGIGNKFTWSKLLWINYRVKYRITWGGWHGNRVVNLTGLRREAPLIWDDTDFFLAFPLSPLSTTPSILLTDALDLILWRLLAGRLAGLLDIGLSM